MQKTNHSHHPPARAGRGKLPTAQPSPGCLLGPSSTIGALWSWAADKGHGLHLANRRCGQSEEPPRPWGVLCPCSAPRRTSSPAHSGRGQPCPEGALGVPCGGQRGGRVFVCVRRAACLCLCLRACPALRPSAVCPRSPAVPAHSRCPLTPDPHRPPSPCPAPRPGGTQGSGSAHLRPFLVSAAPGAAGRWEARRGWRPSGAERGSGPAAAGAVPAGSTAPPAAWSRAACSGLLFEPSSPRPTPLRRRKVPVLLLVA